MQLSMRRPSRPNPICTSRTLWVVSTSRALVTSVATLASTDKGPTTATTTGVVMILKVATRVVVAAVATLAAVGATMTGVAVEVATWAAPLCLRPFKTKEALQAWIWIRARRNITGSTMTILCNLMGLDRNLVANSSFSSNSSNSNSRCHSGKAGLQPHLIGSLSATMTCSDSISFRVHTLTRFA